MLLIKNILI
jgi:hypothetical protein